MKELIIVLAAALATASFALVGIAAARMLMFHWRARRQQRRFQQEMASRYGARRWWEEQ